VTVLYYRIVLIRPNKAAYRAIGTYIALTVAIIDDGCGVVPADQAAYKRIAIDIGCAMTI
jgi:hypothetical protein